MRQPVLGSRAPAKVNARTIVVGSRWGFSALVGVGRLVSVLPARATHAVARLNDRGVRLYDTMALP